MWEIAARSASFRILLRENRNSDYLFLTVIITITSCCWPSIHPSIHPYAYSMPVLMRCGWITRATSSSLLHLILGKKESESWEFEIRFLFLFLFLPFYLFCHFVVSQSSQSREREKDGSAPKKRFDRRYFFSPFTYHLKFPRHDAKL